MKHLLIFAIFTFSAAAVFALEKAPDTFIAEFKTTKGIIQFNITRSWSPIGVDRFYELLTLSSAEGGSYYNQNGFFRVVPGFVVQFGISGNPAISAKWENAEISDDPVLLSNTEGVLTFATAGPNTRTTQLFINYADNSFLDAQGFSGIGKIIKGYSVATSINSQYGQDPDQGMIYSEGNAYLQQNFPKLDYILSTRIIKKF